jgi:hypothetical protein
MPDRDAVADYLDRLGSRLPRSRWRDDVLAEVADHLLSAVAEAAGPSHGPSHPAAPAAGGRAALTDTQARRRAVARFGAADALAAELVLEHTAGLVRRVSLVQALLFTLLAIGSLVTASGPLLIGYVSGLPQEFATFLLIQLAWTVAALSWGRAWLTRHLVTVPVAELRIILRGAVIAAVSLEAAVLVRVAERLLGEAVRTSAAGLALLLATAAAAGAVAWWAGLRLRRLRPLLPHTPAAPADLAGLGELAGAVLVRRLPAGSRWLAGSLLDWGWRRLGAGRHPARLLSLTCLAAAAWAFQVGAMPDGIWPALASRGPAAAAAAGAVCALAEVAMVLASYLALRKPLRLS